ncbi:circadian clock KaiB family protein [Pelomonas sp. KK5]|uniref:circadian clock KaiB family protein n=1 Tax=Pelomonas sp. KK5 TaxID=1855730 RepID=UPI0018E989F5|nr:circadian clock KaiB family protein [Pelomonas sp. KK5]
MGAAEITQPFILRLYVTDATPKSARAIVNTRRILEEHLHGRYSLEIRNIADNVLAASADQIVATPTLLRIAPLPPRRVIGDMSDVPRVLHGLGVPEPVR